MSSRTTPRYRYDFRGLTCTRTTTRTYHSRTDYRLRIDYRSSLLVLVRLPTTRYEYEYSL
eukprot:scaffold331750_cov20-Prasinocladus_malaysianus.AAC.1